MKNSVTTVVPTLVQPVLKRGISNRRTRRFALTMPDGAREMRSLGSALLVPRKNGVLAHPRVRVPHAETSDFMSRIARTGCYREFQVYNRLRAYIEQEQDL